MKSRFKSFVILVCVLVPTFVSAAPICPYASPSIDGIITEWEWASAQTIDLQVNLPEGGTAPARLYLMNDEKFLYVGVRILRGKTDAISSFSATVDANNDRWLSAGDDLMQVSHVNPSGHATYDAVYFTGGDCPAGQVCSGPDSGFGGSNDVTGAVGADGTYVMYELSKPLAAQDETDASMPVGSSIGMTFSLALHNDGFVGSTFYPSYPWAGLYVDYVIRDCTYWR